MRKKIMRKKSQILKKDNLTNEILKNYQKIKRLKLKKVYLHLIKNLEVKNSEYYQLDKKISQDETALSYLPKQVLENSNTKKFKDEIERLSNFKTPLLNHKF